MRLKALLPATVVVLAGFGISEGHAGAIGESGSSGVVIDVSAQIGGAAGSTPGAVSAPCDDGYYRRTIPRESEDSPGQQTITENGIRKVMYYTFCQEDGSDPDDSGARIDYVYFNVAPPDPAWMIPAMAKLVPDYLDAPTVTWPNMSPEHGWLFVKVPMDYRVNNVAFVTVTATVTNLLGSSTASVTATPTTLDFASGDSGGDQCSVVDGRLPYVPRVPGACSFTYQNSSATAPNGYSFDTTTDVTWVSSSAPSNGSLPATWTTSTSQTIPVSEFQSIVTCYGNDC